MRVKISAAKWRIFLSRPQCVKAVSQNANILNLYGTTPPSGIDNIDGTLIENADILDKVIL